MSDSPKPIAAAWSMLRARRLARPAPRSETDTHHDDYLPVLNELASSGVAGLVNVRDVIASYRHRLEQLDPDSLSRDGALAYWLNLYNVGALDLVARAQQDAASSVLGIPGGFSRPWATVAAVSMSLDDIEHGKVRRFGDPRIHAALVCGSVSCPTLRLEPFTSDRIDHQLDDQMRSFLAAGGVARSDSGIELSRVFKWYGGDFVRPHRMPTLTPARSRSVLNAITRWLEPDTAAWVAEERPAVSFQTYDWALACSIG